MSLPGVVLTYGWCRVSYVILDSLARRGVPVHVTDASGLAMCRASHRAASFHRTRHPYRDPEGYVEDVAAALRETGAEVLIPGLEDLQLFALHRRLLPGGTRLAAGPPDLLARTANKLTLLPLAREAGVPVPATFLPLSQDELEALLPRLPYPVVVKPQLGNSAKGVTIAPDAATCRTAALALAQKLGRWPMIQEFAPGDGYGVCLLYNRGELRAAFCERYLRAKDGRLGTSVFRESVHAPRLIELSRSLFDRLDWHGVAHLDFLWDGGERPALLEVNPRFWGALDLAVRAGVDFPWLLYRMLADGDVAPCFDYREGITSRWIVGELLHGVNRLRRGELGELGRWLWAVADRRADGCDDFRPDDPLPLAAEMAYYGSRFLATGSVNPVVEGMLG